MKLIKRGYKLWCIADQSGYVKKFDIYQGKDEITKGNFESYGLSERVILLSTENKLLGSEQEDSFRQLL